MTMSQAQMQQPPNVDTAIAEVQTYLDVLLNAKTAAAMQNDATRLRQLRSAISEAFDLEEQLLAIGSMAAVASLDAEINAVRAAANNLASQKQHLDAIVRAVGIAADVLTAITNIVLEVAAL